MLHAERVTTNDPKRQQTRVTRTILTVTCGLLVKAKQSARLAKFVGTSLEVAAAATFCKPKCNSAYGIPRPQQSVRLRNIAELERPLSSCLGRCFPYCGLLDHFTRQGTAVRTRLNTGTTAGQRIA